MGRKLYVIFLLQALLSVVVCVVMIKVVSPDSVRGLRYEVAAQEVDRKISNHKIKVENGKIHFLTVH